MTVVRLKDGKLWVHSPLEITEGVKEELQHLGDVAYVVAPNNMHYMYFQRFLEVFPQAEGYVAPSLVEKKPAFGQYQPLSELKHVVGREIQQTEFQGHTLGETAFFHKPSKTLIVADLLYNIQPTNLPLEKGVMWVFGAYGKAAIPFYHKVAMKDKQAIQASGEMFCAPRQPNLGGLGALKKDCPRSMETGG